MLKYPEAALLLSALFLNSLAAYSIAGVPFPWLGAAGLIIGAGALFVSGRPLRGPFRFFVLVSLFLIWTTASALLNADDLVDAMGGIAYVGSGGLFVALRILNIITFGVAVVVVTTLNGQGHKFLIDGVVALGAFVALAALYIYAAQVWGLPEPPRTRMGTSGQEQATRFSYAFHRAMGTFREPSHLAEWLIAPLLLGALRRTRRSLLAASVMLAAVLLSGSLTGLLGLIAGLTVWAFAEALRLSHRSLKRVVVGGLIAGTALVGFDALAASYSASSVNLFGTLADRLAPLVEEGPAGTNRGYVYKYLGGAAEITMTGQGPGTANLIFSEYRGITLVSSFLSLYINTLLSIGVVGLLLLCGILLLPIAIGVHQFKSRVGSPTDIGLLMGSYAAWIVVYGAHAEELAVIFAVPYGLLLSLPQLSVSRQEATMFSPDAAVSQ